MAPPLRLLAEDAQDLAIISAALQDAVGRVGDIRYERTARRLTVGLNRFRWEPGARSPERVRAVFQLGGVLEVKARRLRRDAREAVLELLGVIYAPADAPGDPGGTVTLAFAGDGDLRVRVEVLDAVLADVSPPWPARRAPRHDLDADVPA